MRSAGMLQHRARFEYRAASADDGYGNVIAGDWTARVSRWVSVQPDLGGESEQAGRLQSTTGAKIKVRRNAATDAITPADRVVFTAGPYAGMTAQIRSIVRHTDGATYEMRLEFGVAE